MLKPIRPHLGVSAQQRIEQRKHILLDAAYENMKQGTWQHLSITQLCEQANLNKRYFYQSFNSLDELAQQIFERLTLQLQTQAFSAIAQARLKGLSEAEFAKYVLNAVVDFFVDDPTRVLILFTDQLTGRALTQHRLKVKQQLIEVLSEYSKQHYDGQALTDPMIKMTSTFLIAGTIELLQQWLDGEFLISKEQLVIDLSSLWQGVGDYVASYIAKRCI